MNEPRVVVDADALVAQIHSQDTHHQAATSISQALVDHHAEVIYPTTAIAEATTHVQRVLNSAASAHQAGQLFTDPRIHVAEVGQHTLTQAAKFFSPKASKRHTIFDCLVAAIAEEYQADAIFSFDKFYPKHGFKLASDLVTELEK